MLKNKIKNMKKIHWQATCLVILFSNYKLSFITKLYGNIIFTNSFQN